MKYALFARKAECDTPENHLIIPLKRKYYSKEEQ
jgi:hypothetical protein